MNTTEETREVVQDSDEARQLEREGWRYWRTYHDSDKRSMHYGKRIDIYRLETKNEGEQAALSTCPVCLAAHPGTVHLLQEYKDMQTTRFGMFGRNAVTTQNAVAALLLARGITHIPNIFGDIPIVISEPYV